METQDETLHRQGPFSVYTHITPSMEIFSGSSLPTEANWLLVAELLVGLTVRTRDVSHRGFRTTTTGYESHIRLAHGEEVLFSQLL